MAERFVTPEGELCSNVGLLPGTVIQELRMHPYQDCDLDGIRWNYRPEFLEFTIVSIDMGSYQCRYAGAERSFCWPFWEEQPDHGFMRDGCTLVRFYARTVPLPPPHLCQPASTFSPYVLRCVELDTAAELLKDGSSFSTAAAEPALPPRSAPDEHVHFERPARQFWKDGGCPLFGGLLCGGRQANVLCRASHVQLHGYVRVKFCEGGRKAYCPIWKSEQEKSRDRRRP